jgi:immunoglobulin-binding protein 1
MSLAEFADIEVAQAIERGQKEAAAEGPVRKIKQLEADGDEERLDLVDLATTEDRNWDAWKEENPRGWGNKMGKRF